jgi:hypothetical protein
MPSGSGGRSPCGPVSIRAPSAGGAAGARAYPSSGGSYQGREAPTRTSRGTRLRIRSALPIRKNGRRTRNERGRLSRRRPCARLYIRRSGILSPAVSDRSVTTCLCCDRPGTRGHLRRAADRYREGKPHPCGGGATVRISMSPQRSCREIPVPGLPRGENAGCPAPK